MNAGRKITAYATALVLATVGAGFFLMAYLNMGGQVGVPLILCAAGSAMLFATKAVIDETKD